MPNLFQNLCMSYYITSHKSFHFTKRPSISYFLATFLSHFYIQASFQSEVVCSYQASLSFTSFPTRTFDQGIRKISLFQYKWEQLLHQRFSIPPLCQAEIGHKTSVANSSHFSPRVQASPLSVYPVQLPLFLVIYRMYVLSGNTSMSEGVGS